MNQRIVQVALALVIGVGQGRGQHNGAAVIAQTPATERPDTANQLVRAIGVDTHFIYRDTSYVTLFGPVSRALIESDITRIRDGSSPAVDYLQRVDFLADHGIQHSAEVPVGSTPEAIRKRLAEYGVANVDLIEPQNEYDSYASKDPLWLTHILEDQRTIWNTLHRDAAFSGITIVGPSMSNPNDYSKLVGVQDFEDAANFHDGTCDREPETSHFPHALAVKHALIRATTPAKPIYTTETGYGDDTARACSLPDAIIAIYDPRLIAYRWLNGERAIYFYQLVDMPKDKIFGSTGLLKADASPKPQFTAIESMLHLLSDPGPIFKPASLNYSLGQVDGLQHLLLAKRDGSFDLMLWLGVRSWDERHHVPLAVSAQPVNITFPTSVNTALVYRYGPDWSLVAQAESLKNHVLTVSVDDRISFISVRP